MSEKLNRSSGSSVSVQRLPQVKSPASTAVSDYDSIDLVREMVKAADERKAGDITVLDVAEISYITEYFMIVTGFSTTQIRAIARSVENRAEELFNRVPEQVEGMSDGGWILLDYGAVIIHVFLPQEREFYDIEAFWGHAEKLDISAFLELDADAATNMGSAEP